MVEKQVLVAPGVDKPEAPVRESLDGAFCHFVRFLKSVLQRCPKTQCSGYPAEKTPFYRINWQKAMARTRERVRAVRWVLGAPRGRIQGV